MGYTFSREAASTFKITTAATSGLQKNLTLKGVNAQTTNADTIVAGVQGLMYIADRANDFNYADGVRVVNEDVDDDT